MALTRTFLLQVLLTAGLVSSLSAASYEPSMILPPKPVREFRGAWVATVNNIDWPSKRGLTTAEQKSELVAMLDRAAQLKLNAIIFQVRPACDAMYASRIEPWSEYLTGTMGKVPEPFYDPLEFAIEEAHKRGIELHAWFNPYRALDSSSKSPVAANHISKTHPELVKKYGKYLWLDPGEHDVQDYTLSVVLDVVKRYDVDGIQFDDYFYPERTDSGAHSDFPDEASWQKYGMRSDLNRSNWRRENVNSFIERAYNSIKAAKPWVKFGISPFGIWRPGNPPQVRGKDAYAERFADARKWLRNGWLDYCAPQLYWPVGSKEQSFPALLNWWQLQNLKDRHLWPGIAVYRANDWATDEIPSQIRIARKESGVTGYIFYNLGNLIKNAALAEALRRDLHSETALVPASPWLDDKPPVKPLVSVVESSTAVKVSFSVTNDAKPWLWLVQTKQFGDWETRIFPGAKSSVSFDFQPEQIAIRAVSRTGTLSDPAVVALRK